HIDADHAHFDLVGKFAGGVAVAGEDGRAIGIFVAVDEVDRILETVAADDREDGAKNLVLVDAHIRLDIVEQRAAYIIAVLIALEPEAAAIDDEAGAFGHARIDIA